MNKENNCPKFNLYLKAKGFFTKVDEHPNQEEIKKFIKGTQNEFKILESNADPLYKERAKEFDDRFYILVKKGGLPLDIYNDNKHIYCLGYFGSM